METTEQEKIRAWQGGLLRVYRTETVFDDPDLPTVRRVSEEERGWKLAEYQPIGDGYAIPELLAGTVEVEGRGEVWIHVGVRNGRAQCVGITSSDIDLWDPTKRDPEGKGAEITQTLVRALTIPREVTNIVGMSAVRLFVDSDGEIAGDYVLNRKSFDDRRSWAEMSGPAVAAHEQTQRARRGRQPLSPEALAEVARIYTEATALRKSYQRAIAERWPGTKPATIRGWVHACRNRENPATGRPYLPMEDPTTSREENDA